MIDKDTAVIEAIKAGNIDAFRQLVDRHKRRLYGVMMRLVGDPDVAEELAQETFVKAYTGISKFRGNSSFGTWLVQIGVHAARDHIRRTQRFRGRRIVSLEAYREEHGDASEPADTRSASDPGSELEGSETAALVQQALSELPPEYREVLVLKHFENWPYERIAEETGDSVGTLKVRAHRARKLLKDRLTGLGWEAGIGG